MTTLLNRLLCDEAGFIVSAELILVGTIAVLSMIVGLSELSAAINHELEDVASAFGSINQSYSFQLSRGHKGRAVGSVFRDFVDACDSQCDIRCDAAPQPELAVCSL